MACADQAEQSQDSDDAADPACAFAFRFAITILANCCIGCITSFSAAMAALFLEDNTERKSHEAQSERDMEREH